MIDPRILERRNEDARRFNTAEPFHYLQIDGFLEREFCQRVLDDFPRFEDRHALNEMGQVGGKAVRMDVRDVSPAYRQLDDYLRSAEFLDYMSEVTGIPALLYDPDYVGGGTHENRDGQGLDAHVDFNYHPRTKTHRRLNLIVYLNHDWEEAWGGALELHSDPWNPSANRTRKILPLFNRAVIFETNEISWHGFERIALPPDRKHLSRKSFAIYLYTRERPAQEAAPPHATIYVPDALPATIAAGSMLETSDVAELQARFTRLRTQLRYLYDREKQFGAQIVALERALAEANAAFRMPLQGYLTADEPPRDMWVDRWAGADFEYRFVPRRKARALELEIWAPDQLDGEQVLGIELDGTSWEHRIAPGRRSRVTLNAALQADREAGLRIRAQRSFIPAKTGESGDARSLCWRLIDATLIQ